MAHAMVLERLGRVGAIAVAIGDRASGAQLALRPSRRCLRATIPDVIHRLPRLSGLGHGWVHLLVGARGLDAEGAHSLCQRKLGAGHPEPPKISLDTNRAT
eukprot:6148449-Pyramimonas_sp.AAC.1